MPDKDTKIFVEFKDYLPEGMTFEQLEKLAAQKPLPLTKENLAKIVDEKYLNMTEEDLIKYMAAQEEEHAIKVPRSTPNQRLVYAENLDENDELNQEFPDVSKQK